MKFENETQQLLLNLLRCSLMHTEVALPQTFDGKALLAEAHAQALEAVALDGIGDAALEPEVRAAWLKRSAIRMANSAKVVQGHREAIAILEQNEIPYVIMKGLASSYYYPNPQFRATGDVDFYVPPSFVAKAKAAFEQNGYTMCNEEHDIHLVLEKNNVKLEMHFRISRFPTKELQSYMDTLYSSVCDTAVTRTCQGVSFQMPRPALQGLILLQHAQKHLSAGELGMRQICDFALFCASEDMILSSEELQHICRDVGLDIFLRVMVKIAVLYFDVDPARVPFCMEADDNACNAVILSCFHNGNFGSKTTGQIDITRSVGNTGRSKASIVWSNLINGARSTMPIMRRCPPLLVFAPICLSVRYLFRVCTGKRNLRDIRAQKAILTEKNQLRAYLKMYEK